MSRGRKSSINQAIGIPAGSFEGKIKSFKPAKRLGFVRPDELKQDILFYRDTLKRCSIAVALIVPGRRVRVEAERFPTGLRATHIELLEARAT